MLPSIYVEATMDAVELIKQDHRHIQKLVARFLETESDLSQEDLYQQIQAGLNAHADMEEQIFYPVIKPFAPDAVQEAIEDHVEVKELLDDLLGSDLNEEEFEAEFRELMEDVRYHIEQEESPGGLLDLARRNLDPQKLEEMGEQI